MKEEKKDRGKHNLKLKYTDSSWIMRRYNSTIPPYLNTQTAVGS